MTLIFALLGGCAVMSSMTLLYARSRRARADAAPPPPRASAPPSAPSPYAALPLALTDVVSANGEERWLSGGVVCREGGRVVAVLFLAPEGGELRAVGVLAPPIRSLAWLAPAPLQSAPEPPGAIDLNGLVYTRQARRPVELERVGSGAPPVGAEGRLALYEARARDVAWVLSTSGQTFAFVGERVDEGAYDRMGSGGVESSA